MAPTVRLRGEGGVTLVELVVSITILAVIVGAIGTSLVAFVRLSEPARGRFVVGDDVNNVASWFAADVQGANPFGGVDTSPATGTGCATSPAHDADNANVVRFTSTLRGRTIHVSYRAVRDADGWKLTRTACDAGQVGETLVAAWNLVDGSPSSVAAAVDGLVVTLSLTVSSEGVVHDVELTGTIRTPATTTSTTAPPPRGTVPLPTTTAAGSTTTLSSPATTTTTDPAAATTTAPASQPCTLVSLAPAELRAKGNGQLHHDETFNVATSGSCSDPRLRLTPGADGPVTLDLTGGPVGWNVTVGKADHDWTRGTKTVEALDAGVVIATTDLEVTP